MKIYDHDGRFLGRTYREAAETLGVAQSTLRAWRRRAATPRARGEEIVQIPPRPRIGGPIRAVFELPDGRRIIGLDAVRAALGGISKARVYQRFRRDDDGVWRERRREP